MHSSELLVQPPKDGCYIVRQVPVFRQVVIPDAFFDELLKAEAVICALRVIEEDFDVLLGNYLEYEATVLRLCAVSMTGIARSLESDDKNRRECHRRVANLLSSARSFIDHTSHNAVIISGKGTKAHGTILQAFRAEYDTRLGYRVMEAVRNYAQHRGAAVSGVRYGVKSERGGSPQFLISPDLSLTELATDKAFKQPLLIELRAEFQNDNDQIPLTPLVREYVGGLAAVLDKTRATFAEAFQAAEDASEAAFDLFLASSGSLTYVGVKAVQYVQGKVVRSVKLSHTERARIARLRQLNCVQRDLGRSLIRA